MPNTNDLSPDPRKLLFIGHNGRGKTLAWASLYKILPAGAKIYCFDFDGRLSPVKTRYPEAGIEYDTFGPKNFLQFRSKVMDLANSPRYAAIILDSVTSCSVSAINYCLDVKGAGKGKNVAGLQTTTWDEVNSETVLFSQVLDVLKTYPGIVVVTAHPVAKTTLTEGGTSIKSQEIVAYGSKIASIIPTYFNEIYSFYKETNIDPNVQAKFFVRTNDEIAKTALNLPGRIDWTGGDFFPMLHALLKERGIDLNKPVSTESGGLETIG